MYMYIYVYMLENKDKKNNLIVQKQVVFQILLSAFGYVHQFRTQTQLDSLM